MSEPQTKAEQVYQNSQVNKLTDTVGVIVLGLLAFALLIALQRAEAHNRALLIQLSQQRRIA